MESQKYSQLKRGAGVEEHGKSIISLFGVSDREADGKHLQTDAENFHIKIKITPKMLSGNIRYQMNFFALMYTALAGHGGGDRRQDGKNVN